MKIRKAMFFIIMAAAVVSTVASAWAAEKKKAAPQDHFNTIVASYLKIQSSLATDKADGVATQAGLIIKAATEAGKLCKDKKVAALLAGIKAQAKALTAKNIKLAAARDAFKPLSESVTRLVKAHFPAKAAAKYAVFYCEMAKAHWLQAGDKTRNPYFGSDMPTCGNRLSDAEYKEHIKNTFNKVKGHKMMDQGDHDGDMKCQDHE